MARARAKQAYLKSTEIQAKIDDGTLDAYDLIFCSDTKEYIILDSQKNILPIKSRLDRYDSEESAIENLNARKDTYVGQIVCIKYKDVYVPYVVNEDENKAFTVFKIYQDKIDFNYDLLSNKPIINITAQPEEDRVISVLEDGAYNIKGTYKIYPSELTTHMTSRAVLYTVCHEDNITYIYEYNSKEIKVYSYDSDEDEFYEDELATKLWVNKLIDTKLESKADKTVATTEADGLMSATDKAKLDSLDANGGFSAFKANTLDENSTYATVAGGIGTGDDNLTDEEKNNLSIIGEHLTITTGRITTTDNGEETVVPAIKISLSSQDVVDALGFMPGASGEGIGADGFATDDDINDLFPTGD